MLQRARQRRVLPPRSHPSGLVENNGNGGEVTSQDRPIVHLSTHMRTPSDVSRMVTSPTISTTGTQLQSPTYTLGVHYDNILPGYETMTDQELPCACVP